MDDDATGQRRGEVIEEGDDDDPPPTGVSSSSGRRLIQSRRYRSSFGGENAVGDCGGYTESWRFAVIFPRGLSPHPPGIVIPRPIPLTLSLSNRCWY